MQIKSEDDFIKIDNAIAEISRKKKEGQITEAEISEINRSFGEEFIENTIQGHGLKKPFGYAGDFLMIEKIYTYHKSPIEAYKIWDEYFHAQAAPKAVRNRKEYFKRTVKDLLLKSDKMDLLNVASGPGRDLFELYSDLDDVDNLNTTCIEMDLNAIEHAQELNRKFLGNIKFLHKNIFRVKEQNKYDVIWSAGLFDYFNDKAFVLILKKFKNWLKEEGQIIIGNFNEEHNPSRDYMELFGEWYLNHRTEAQLIQLAEEAGFEKKQVWIGKESENVNLFLHIKLSK